MRTLIYHGRPVPPLARMMSSRKMKAAILYGPHDVRIESLNVPKPKPGWVLIRTRATGICGSDLHFFKQQVSIPVNSELGPGRYVPGHELSGEVVETGPSVKDLQVGDRVVVEPTIGCGTCKWCNIGAYNICPTYKLIGFYYNGGLAEYCTVPADKCLKLPDKVSFQEAATLDCIAVAEHAVRRGAICSEDVVAVLGAGSIGLFVAQAAMVAGAREVYCVGNHDFQLRTAKELGVTGVINTKKEKPVERIVELTGNEGVDKVIEAVGGESSVISEGTAMLRRGGTFVLTGIFVKPMSLDFFGFLFKELTIVSAWGYAHWTHMKEMEVGLRHLASGRIVAKKLVTHEFPLARAAEAFEVALDKEKSKSIKVQISSS